MQAVARRLVVSVFVVGSALLQLPAVAAADGDAAGDRATSFQSVEGAVKEDVPGGPLLLGAYGFVWLALFGYVLRLGRLSARTEQQVELLQRALAKSGAPDASKDQAG